MAGCPVALNQAVKGESVSSTSRRCRARSEPPRRQQQGVPQGLARVAFPIPMTQCAGQNSCATRPPSFERFRSLKTRRAAPRAVRNGHGASRVYEARTGVIRTFT